jgi:hypothetical protein
MSSRGPYTHSSFVRGIWLQRVEALKKSTGVVTDPLTAANSFVKPDIVSVPPRKEFP